MDDSQRSYINGLRSIQLLCDQLAGQLSGGHSDREIDRQQVAEWLTKVTKCANSALAGEDMLVTPPSPVNAMPHIRQTSNQTNGSKTHSTQSHNNVDTVDSVVSDSEDKSSPTHPIDSLEAFESPVNSLEEPISQSEADSEPLIADIVTDTGLTNGVSVETEPQINLVPLGSEVSSDSDSDKKSDHSMSSSASRLKTRLRPKCDKNGAKSDNQSSVESSVASFDDSSDTPESDSDSDFQVNGRSSRSHTSQRLSKFDRLLKDFRLQREPKVDLVKLDNYIVDKAEEDATIVCDPIVEAELQLKNSLIARGVVCRKMKTIKKKESQNKGSEEEEYDADAKELKRLCRIPKINKKREMNDQQKQKNGDLSDEIDSDNESDASERKKPKPKKNKRSTPLKEDDSSDPDCDISNIKGIQKNFFLNCSKRKVDAFGSDVSSEEEVQKKPKENKKSENKKSDDKEVVKEESGSDEDIEEEDEIKPDNNKSIGKALRSANSVIKKDKSIIEINSDSDEEIVTKRDKKKSRRRVSDDEDFNGNLSDKESSEDSAQESGMDPSASDSDFDGSDSDSKSKKKSKKSKAKKSKTKRKRVRVEDSSDDCQVVSDGDENDSPNKSRKKLRKIMSDKKIQQTTKDAAEAERERIKRIKEKQKEYNDLKETRSLKSSEVKELILEFDKETKEPLVEVDRTLVKFLKPHQLNGIEFMYNCVVETTDQLEGEGSEGSGCILAHSMGLGKTLQVITFLYTILTHERIKKHIKRALVIAPVNTIKNWANEFRIWLNDNDLDDVLVFEMFDAKTMPQRAELLRIWYKRGGVMIIGLTLFSSLVMGGRGKKPSKSIREAFEQCLLDPGPDVVICDEGHLLKNEKTAYNKAVSKLRTLRRVVLTGTPLQNNLNEYHVMVHFVKPNLLGSKKEFTNRFVNPITNGQHEDSTEYDVKIMKKRVHILHTLLNGCVHRCDYGVLVPYLQPKYEYVMSVMLTEKQIELYSYYLENLTDKAKLSLLADYGSLRLIWNHPILLFEQHRRRLEKQNEDSLDEFINDDEEEEYETPPSGQDSDIECLDDTAGPSKAVPKRRIRTRNQKVESGDEEEELEVNSPASDDAASNAWFSTLLKKDEAKEIELSGKFILLFSILEECEKLGDKILLFSQSLDTLDLVEEMLKIRMDRAAADLSRNSRNESLESDATNVWIKNRDYFRLDGSTASDYRKQWIDVFNDENNFRARLFLISTKAGGLGINLVGANRCIIFDASWNPTHDVQAIFRIFRFGQKKPVYVYRFVAQGTMEEKIYERQIIKQSLSCRVVDEQAIQRHFKASELSELYVFKPDKRKERPTLKVPKDRLLAELIKKHKDYIVNYHEHDSLLESKPEEDMTEEEKQAAWNEYEQEKDALFLREQQEREAMFQRQHLYQQAQQQAQAQQQYNQQMQQQQQQLQYIQMLQRMQAHNQSANLSSNINPTNYEQMLTNQIYQQIMRSNAEARQQAQQRYQEAKQQRIKELQEQAQLLSRDKQVSSLPGYDKLTVDDIGAYIKSSNPSVDSLEMIQQIFRIIETGLNTCNAQLNEAKLKLAAENTPEVRSNYEKLAKEVFNLNMQKNRAQALFRQSGGRGRSGPSILRQNHTMPSASTSSAKTAAELIEEVD